MVTELKRGSQCPRLAVAVELLEALAIVLAVGISRRWRDAALGAIAGALACAVIVEKWLKAVMSSRELVPPRTHDVTRLIELLEAEGVELPRSHEQLDEFTIYAVPLRYDELLDTEPLDRAKTIGLVDEVAAWAQG